VQTLEAPVEAPVVDAHFEPCSANQPEPLHPEFAGIYEAHSRPIYYLALRLLGDPVMAEDATHDVFLKAFRKFDSFRGDAEVRTWLYRITLNHCSNLRQSWHARNVHAQSDESVFEQAVGPAESPLRVLEVSELGERIQRSLDSLPEEYRILLLLVADEELSYDQIAELTQQTADAVRGKLHRARKAFAHAFKKTA
jgi:RNA polymerase sigma-70 factor (ECF subfamily)